MVKMENDLVLGYLLFYIKIDYMYKVLKDIYNITNDFLYSPSINII